MDFRLRNINFEMDGTWYMVTFRTRLSGRITDIKISKSSSRTGYYYPCGAKIDPQYIPAVEALDMFRRSLAGDIRAVLRRFFPKQ